MKSMYPFKMLLYDLYINIVIAINLYLYRWWVTISIAITVWLLSVFVVDLSMIRGLIVAVLAPLLFYLLWIAIQWRTIDLDDDTESDISPYDE